MAVSKKLQQQMMEGGWIRKMFEEGIALKKKYGERNVFDLSLGNPVIEPPDEFRRELHKWVESPVPGMHRYMPNAGYPETREAVAKHLSMGTGLPFTQNEIVMTCGAAGGLNVVLKTIVAGGDEVVIFSPYFVEYIYYIDNHGALPRVVPTDNEFIPDIELLEENIIPGTRAVILNSPNNPTGAVYDDAVMRGIGELLGVKQKEYGREIYLISDDIYRRLVYDGVECPYVFRYHNASIVVTSHSKDLAVPGERIGYIAVNPRFEEREELINGLVFCNRVLGFVNAPALMQHLVQALQEASVDVTLYEKKRDLLYNSLVGMGYSVVKPHGAFYIFPKSPIEDDVAFVKELQKHNVLVVPGKGFGAPGYFRISYCLEDWVIEGSLPGFRAVAKDFGLC
ncbi:MAG: pyridoxal phosphate-dependent aminotransferase [Dehalococcoidia bacterium]|nr:MAG: pyridoxal phosphate-dependent aminotransferase [Dehalococcoidia bacterium]